MVVKIVIKGRSWRGWCCVVNKSGKFVDTGMMRYKVYCGNSTYSFRGETHVVTAIS